MPVVVVAVVFVAAAAVLGLVAGVARVLERVGVADADRLVEEEEAVVDLVHQVDEIDGVDELKGEPGAHERQEERQHEDEQRPVVEPHAQRDGARHAERGVDYKRHVDAQLAPHGLLAQESQVPALQAR